jgi:hypothetical protein
MNQMFRVTERAETSPNGDEIRTSVRPLIDANGYQNGYHAEIDDLAGGSRPANPGGAEGTRTPDPHTARQVTVVPVRAGSCRLTVFSS